MIYDADAAHTYMHAMQICVCFFGVFLVGMLLAVIMEEHPLS